MEADPDELLAWLKGDGSGERDLQIIALEQLCMLVLMSDNIDRCFEQYQPRLFLPALCDIFSDPLAPSHVLEVTARALTYFLDVSVDCAKKITSHTTIIRSMCSCLQAVDIDDRTNKDLAEQIIKVFERLCSRETSSIYEQDGLRCVLEFINNCYSVIHKDSLQSALNVVVKLIGKIDPQNSSTLDQTIESLSNLLLHDDAFVADNALRCFATLADRYARKNVDPEPLMRYCLKDVLLRSLHHVSKSSSETHNASHARGVTTNLSVVTGLLSTLCRGSTKATHDLLRSDLPDALEAALCGGDERCVLDIMRFLDLLILLLFEGRQALPRPGSTLRATNPSVPTSETPPPPPPPPPQQSLLASTATTTTATAAAITATPSDRSQQQIIEYIRSRDLQAFINYIEENAIDVNYTDNVGQTMLNWVAAFGTREMVEYLCRRGADVNRGQRSSSLHYAACFGRASIVRLLLKHGGNIDLRDEDGRTPLDKARERQDDSHQEVVDILQSAHEWTDTKQSSTTEKTKGDIEMQSIYLERLLSIFCQLYQNTMILTIKRSTLRLISKLIQYATIEQIRQLTILTTLFELLSTILDTNEDDNDTSNIVVLIIKNLFEKDRCCFLEQFQYLGLISKITTLALSHATENPKFDQLVLINLVCVDAKDILCSRPYVWNEFNFLRNRECLYVWNGYTVIELSMGSNGWFRFFTNNSLSTMYSSGSPETHVDTDENRHDFIDKFQRLKQQVLDGIDQEKDSEKQQMIVARTIFTSEPTNETIITVGSWTLQCQEPTQLRIHNIEGEQVTILEHDQSGFIFESNRGTRHAHTTDTRLNNEFAIPWSTIDTLTSSSPSSSVTLNKKDKQEHTKQRSTEIALFIYDEYIKNVSPTNYTRSILFDLQSIVNDLNNELNVHSFVNLKNLLEKLKNFLLEKTSLSIYELSSSGLVSTLLQIFHGLLDQSNHLSSNDQVYERSKLFCSVFLSDEQPQAFQILIRKLISILEAIEKLPLFLYDAPFNYGLQIFSKRFRFQIQYKNEQQLFTDQTGKSLKIEPLATVGQLKTFLASMVSKQWYDHPHSHFEFVKQLKSSTRPTFIYTNDFDQNGILYWIGTNGKTIADYTNPCSPGLVSVNCTDNNCSSQQLSDMISHTPSTDDNDDGNRGYSWVMIDLGLLIIPTHVTLRHGTGGFAQWSKTLVFQLSKDASHFTPCEVTLMTESNSPTATWTMKNILESSSGFRYIRIHQKSGRHPVCIAGLEVYGQVLSAVDIRSKPELNRSRSSRDDPRNRSTNARQNPPYNHSHSTSAATTRANKMQSHILRRLASMNTPGNSTSTNENRSGSSTIDRILFDLSSIPTDLSTALASDDPERLRLAIEETLSRLTDDTTLNENSNLLNLISQRKSISTPDISNGETTFSVSSTEQASSADNLVSSSRATDQVVNLMQGFCDQIARQYDALVTQTQIESTSSEDFLAPTYSDTTTADSWLEFSGLRDEPIVISKDESSTETENTCPTIQLTSNTEESVELLSAVNEENNKKNATNESTEQQIISSENDLNVSVPNLSTTDISSLNILITAQTFSSDVNIPTPTTINIASIPVIDDDTNPIEEPTTSSEQQQKLTDETTTDEEDDEYTLLKRLKATTEQIDAPVGEDEDEEEQQDEEEEYNDEIQEQLHGQQQEIKHRNWDEEFVLKRQFSVLLPAFDGRPGRTNINATQDIPVPTTISPKEATSTKRVSNTDALAAANMTLFIRGPSPQITGLKEIEIEMDDSDATIFKYVQQLINPFPSSQRYERIKRIFEPTYTIVYTEKSNEHSQTNTSSFNEFHLSDCSNDICTIEDILKLLRQLYYLSTNYIQTIPYHHDETFSIDSYFHSKKLNNKLLQQIQDSILITSLSLPSWTSWLTHSYKFLYPFETRQLYFRTTSFGTSRSIVWLQERREELIRTVRNSSHLRSRVLNENSLHEFRFGRLKIDRSVGVDRENILRDAMNLFHYHAKSKSKLEIQFLNEEGTGDGPTLEFYALIANDLQKYQLGLWWNHDDFEYHQTDYVRKLEGLFPAPYPQDNAKLDDVCNYFSLMGIYFAKCLLDKYLIDMPLSIAFFKLLCMKSKAQEIWYDGILDLNDLITIEPSRGKIFQNLFQLIERRNQIMHDDKKTNDEKIMQCKLLKIENDSHEPVDIEHLCLTFVYSPPSNTYGYQSYDLIPNGSHTDVTIDNIDQYINLSLQFIFRDGIKRQMDAFRNGFNQVFSLDHLQCFNPQELQLLLCGNQWPSWTLDDLLTYIEPSHGFTRESPGFTKFLNVMLALDGLERKSVVQFITGCSSLPPGGLANLRPRLSVARKVEADDHSYPSVNTCYHYLKLPDYTSEEILKLRLMTACQERGFYFN